jgi:hypothetical protein
MACSRANFTLPYLTFLPTEPPYLQLDLSYNAFSGSFSVFPSNDVKHSVKMRNILCWAWHQMKCFYVFFFSRFQLETCFCNAKSLSVEIRKFLFHFAYYRIIDTSIYAKCANICFDVFTAATYHLAPWRWWRSLCILLHLHGSLPDKAS